MLTTERVYVERTLTCTVSFIFHITAIIVSVTEIEVTDAPTCAVAAYLIGTRICSQKVINILICTFIKA